MTRPSLLRILLALALAAGAVLAGAGGVSAHEERDSVFPDQNAPVPVYRPFDEAIPHLVVCKPESAAIIAEMTDPELKQLNEHLLGECEFEHIQEAVDAVTSQGTNIYVLPGTYREEPNRTDPCQDSYDGGVLTYEQNFECGAILNLLSIAGDSPQDEDIICDLPVCNLQIEGTGERPTDVVLYGGFKEDKDWVKHNGLKADRLDGFYLKNFSATLFRENAIYVHETDGYVLDEIVAWANDLYGILTFTSDHGVIKNCETFWNGDSGIYPGSAADVNADTTATDPFNTGQTGPLDRWSTEIVNCKSHHNALGHSGTAGNSIYIHDSEWYANGAGIVVDSFVPNHPGMPQDHLWVENNRIYANNVNYYANVQGDDAPCSKEPADVGYERGVVCPAFQVPVGTGILIAGGNNNYIVNNHIYDNWRNGVMQFWVPPAMRDEFNPVTQFEVSNGNQYVDNVLGEHPGGFVQPNGVDFWWDDQGGANCWQGNTSSAGEPTHNASDPRGLPDCDSGGSVFALSNPVKSAGLVPCATYDRNSEPDPAGCNWFEDQSQPEGREGPPPAGEPEAPPAPGGTDEEPVAAPGGRGPATPQTGLPPGLLLGALAALVGAVALRRWRHALVAVISGRV